MESVKNSFTVRNDTTWSGLRRFHVISNEPIGESEFEQMAIDEDGVIKFSHGWIDPELGVNHYYLIWRNKMLSVPFYCTEIERNPKRIRDQKPAIILIGEAVARAAAKYCIKFERWPNRAIIRDEELAAIAGHKKGPIEIPMDYGADGIGTVVINPVAINFQMGIVGVYIEDDDEYKKSGSQTVEM